MNVEIIISTYSDRINHIDSIISHSRDDLCYLIIHQDPEGRYRDYDDSDKFNRDSVRYLRFEEAGLSVSRNRGLDNAIGDIVFLTDDDVSFNCDKIDNVLSLFKSSDADIITYMSCDSTGVPRNFYKDFEFTHSRYSLLRVSSIEFAIRLSSVHQKSLRWDERFGLGSRFVLGDETIFLQDAHKKGCKCKFIPEYLVIHPIESSGRNYNNINGLSRGAVYARIFGVSSFIYCLAFMCRKGLTTDFKTGKISYFLSMIMGIFSYYFEP